MNCQRTRQVIDAYLDGELDRATRLELAEHLGACAVCAKLHAERDAVSQHVRAEVPYFKAPAALKQRILGMAGTRVERRPLRSLGPSWLQAAALSLLVGTASALIGYHAGRPPAEDSMHEAALTHHVASLSESGRPVEVASPDRHAIKPWLQGKIDFAPVVRDLGDRGYTLIGARIERMEGRNAVAMVYRVRNHTISVFAWRTDGAATQAPDARGMRGFSVVTWSHEGVGYAAISDIDARELGEFALLLRAPSDPAS